MKYQIYNISTRIQRMFSNPAPRKTKHIRTRSHLMTGNPRFNPCDYLGQRQQDGAFILSCKFQWDTTYKQNWKFSSASSSNSSLTCRVATRGRRKFPVLFIHDMRLVNNTPLTYLMQPMKKKICTNSNVKRI